MSEAEPKPALTAVQREVEAPSETSIIEWRDLKLTIPSSIEDWDDEMFEAGEKGHTVGLLRALVGSEVYNKLRIDFKRLHGHKIKKPDLDALGKILADFYGFEVPGE